MCLPCSTNIARFFKPYKVLREELELQRQINMQHIRAYYLLVGADAISSIDRSIVTKILALACRRKAPRKVLEDSTNVHSILLIGVVSFFGQ
jgi:hypothetical protein